MRGLAGQTWLAAYCRVRINTHPRPACGGRNPRQRGSAHKSACHHRAGEAGLTLIEVLVAITLLSMLSVGLLLAMRTGLNTFAKARDSLMADRRVAGAQRILEQEIAGLVPVVSPCLGAQAGGPARQAFFQGEPQTMRLVSTFSLQGAWRGRPQILEMAVISGENGRGVRLIVNEIPYAGTMSAGRLCMGWTPDPVTNLPIPRFASVQASPQSFVLADNLEYCRFSYLAPGPQPGLPPSWTARWAVNNWPRGVRIEMAPLEPARARLQPISVTALLPVLRDPMVPYVDQ